jgi:hypothetical protein
MHLLGIDWVGLNAENGKKLLLSIVFVAVLLIASTVIRFAIGLLLNKTDQASIQTKFWTRQGVSLLTTIILILGLVSWHSPILGSRPCRTWSKSTRPTLTCSSDQQIRYNPAAHAEWLPNIFFRRRFSSSIAFIEDIIEASIPPYLARHF